jgi:protein SCO1/2
MFYIILKPVEILPIYQPAEVNEKLVDSSIIHVAKYHKISDFKLTNQNGKEITQANYKDKIYIADFFFTTCQDICPVMTKSMYKLQEELKSDNEILLLSHTVIPEIDTVEQLKQYAIENKVDDSKWNLVTGDKKQIYELARKSYLAVEDSEFNKFDMIHTENFILIDKKKQIRGFYDGTNEKEIEQLLSDIQILKKEKYD